MELLLPYIQAKKKERKEKSFIYPIFLTLLLLVGCKQLELL